MAKKQPMDAATKQRLKELAAAKKGRETLAGIDPLGWAGGIDTVLAADKTPRVRIYADGRLDVEGDTAGVWHTKLSWFSQDKLLTYWGGQDLETPAGRKSKVKRAAVGCPWVRLSYTRPGQLEDLERAFGCRRICYTTYGGPGKGHVPRTDPVFPADKIVALFKLLWPGDDRDGREAWVAKFAKYAAAYTEKAVEYMEEKSPPPAGE